MKVRLHSFRHANVVLKEPQFNSEYEEIIQTLLNISEDDIIIKHESYDTLFNARRPKSISVAINQLIDDRLTSLGWNRQSSIFQESGYTGETWMLDFAKKLISVEVAFNHSTVIAWNLIKPVLASELNHVVKAVQTEVGVIICATSAMRVAGGFDGAVGTFEKFLTYLAPMRDILTVPILLIGIEPPNTFSIHQASVNGSRKGFISMLPGFQSPIPLIMPPVAAVPLSPEPEIDETASTDLE